MIELRGVQKSFGKTEVLKDVSFSVPTGSVFGMVGVNGAGKSTLLRLLAGVLRPDGGEILFDGAPVFENTAVKRGIFFLADDPYYAAGTTGKQLAALYRTFYPDFDEAGFARRCERFSPGGGAPIHNFSKGMKRQLFLSLALACRPKYLLLDEAFDGLDPAARLECRRAIIDIGESGTTTVIASHSLRELTDICTDFALIGEGRVRRGGNLEENLSAVHKFQAAFPREIEQGELPFPCVRFEREGRVVRFVARGDADAILQSLHALGPLFAEEVPVDFEEFFLVETEGSQR